MDNNATLARDWLEAKRAESKANAERIRIENLMADAFEVPAEGSKTTNIEGFKVTMTQPYTRKVDDDRWGVLKAHCPKEMWPVKWKLEADAAGMKWLLMNKPEIWAKIAPAFETKPGKIGVMVEVKE
jgi:hypothetical protein